MNDVKTALDRDSSIMICSEPNVRKTAIIFSSVNSNSFSYYRLFENFAGRVNRIYVRDPMDMWYTRGISREIASVEALNAHLGKVLEALGTEATMTFGSSMGGYAAALFGSLLGVDRVAAISPQTILDRRLPHTPREQVPMTCYDLSPIVEAHSPAQGVILFGAADFVDIFNVMRVSWQGYRIWPILDQDHLVAHHLARGATLKAWIEAFIDDADGIDAMVPSLDDQIDQRCYDEVLQALIFRAVEGFYLNAGWDHERYLEAILTLDGTWAAAAYLLSLVYRKEGRIDKAVAHAEQAVRLAPASVTIADSFAALLRQAGRTEDAVRAYEHSLRIRPKHYASLCALGDLFTEAQQWDRARHYLEQAVEIRPRLNRARELLALVSRCSPDSTAA